MIRSKLLACCAIAAIAALGTQAQATTVNVGQSTAPWLGYMNVFELDTTTFVFGQPWGVPDLKATFDDPNAKLTLEATPIGTADGFWYQNGTGGSGATGNKWMEANLYQEFTDDPAFSGQTVTFNFNTLANTFSQNSTRAFIRDFAPDYSSSNDVFLDITAPAFYSFDLATDAGAGRHVQVGFQTTGVNVWPGDEGALGNIMIATIPEPASLSLVGLCGLALIARRRIR